MASETRTRILAEAMQQFAAKGYRGTTIGSIEAAVGLAPRRGALYRHFASKEALLIAVVDEYSVDVSELGASVLARDTTDVRPTLDLAVRGVLDVLDRQRALLRILQRDLDQLPEAVAAAVHERLVASGYEFARQLFERMLGEAGRVAPSARGLASVALGAIVHFREDDAVYGVTPAGATDEEFIDAWVDLMCSLLDSPAE